MFYDNFLTMEEKVLMKDNYSSVLECIDNNNALIIIEILKEHKCDFLNDLIINYLEIFLVKPKIFETRLMTLKEEIGESYMNIIKNNLNLLVD